MPDLSPPAPQANNLEVVAAVTDALVDGPLTSSEIATAIGMVERQGAYYAAAAATLGLVTREDADWVLSDTGRQLAAASMQTRAALLAELVSACGHVAAYLEGDDAFRDSMQESGELSGETLGRRRATIEQWLDFATMTLDAQAAELAKAKAVAVEHTPHVRAARLARRQPVRQARSCPRCMTQMAITVTVCEYCC